MRDIAVYHLINEPMRLTEESDVVIFENVIDEVVIYFHKQIFVFIVFNCIPYGYQFFFYDSEVSLTLNQFLNNKLSKWLGLIVVHIQK